MLATTVLIKGDGYVSADVLARLLSRPQINGQLAQVFADTVQFASGLLGELPVGSQQSDEGKQKVMAIVMLARVLEISESTLILAAHGVRQELSTLFRVFLDAYFLLANICSDPGFLPTYFRTDEAERLKLMRAATKHDTELFRELTKYATVEVQSDLDLQIKEERIQAFNSFLYAKQVGCVEVYDSMYRLCSASVHSSPRALEKYIEIDDDGYITTVVHEGNNEAIHRVLYDMHCFFAKALLGVCELFGLEAQPVQQFEARRNAAVKE